MEPTAMKANSCVERQKIKTHFARIVVGGTAEKPCYGILYFDPTDGKYHQGFGSYVLEYVFNWLAEEFEIVGDAFSNEPDRHSSLTPTGYDEVYAPWGECKECGADNLMWAKYCQECGAKLDRGASDA